MSRRSFTDESGDTWEWDETLETLKALEVLHKNQKEQKIIEENTKIQKALLDKPKFSGNYKGPHYAQHPDLIQSNKVVITEETTE